MEGGCLEMGKIRLKMKAQPPLTKQNLLNFKPPSPSDNSKVHPPPPPPSTLSPSIGTLIPNLGVGCLPQAQKSTSNDSSTSVFSPSESLDSDSKVVLSSHELLYSSSSVPSLAAFPFAWLRTRLVKSALPNSTVGFSILFNYNNM